MYFHIVGGTESYTTSTTNMYDKDRFHVPVLACHTRPFSSYLGTWNTTVNSVLNGLLGLAANFFKTCLSMLRIVFGFLNNTVQGRGVVDKSCKIWGSGAVVWVKEGVRKLTGVVRAAVREQEQQCWI